jgi:hypothetical protein
VKAGWVSSKSFAIYLFCVFLFSSLAGISHFTPYPALAALPLSAKNAHHETCALQAEDSGADLNENHDFAKLCAVWATLRVSVASWHLHTHRSPFFKRIENYSLLPRSPPL